MTRLMGRPRLIMVAIATVAVVFVLLRMFGAFTIGAVVTDSMEPGLPVGTLFLSLPLEADEGSIIMFQNPSGDRIVHRVVAIDDDGLTTKGDANLATDQAQGWPKVDPANAQVVPSPMGIPLAVTTPVKGFALIAASQLLLIGIAVFAGIRMTREETWLRPNHLLFVFAAGLLMAAPWFETTMDEADDIRIDGSFVAVVVHVSTEDGSGVWRLDAFEEKATGLQGPATVTVVPALPGAQLLIPYGPVAGFFPLALVVFIVGVLFRIKGA